MRFFGMRVLFFCFKQKTAYEMRISDWSSDVCSSDLLGGDPVDQGPGCVVHGSACLLDDRGKLADAAMDIHFDERRALAGALGGFGDRTALDLHQLDGFRLDRKSVV